MTPDATTSGPVVPATSQAVTAPPSPSWLGICRNCSGQIIQIPGQRGPWVHSGSRRAACDGPGLPIAEPTNNRAEVAGA